MHVWMVKQRLAPGVEHSGESDARTEVLGIGGDLEKGLCGGTKEEFVEQLLILQTNRAKLFREREDDVEVAYGEQILGSGVIPLGSCHGLALRTMAIATGVVDGHAMPAVIALVRVAAHVWRPAGSERLQNRALLGRRRELLQEVVSVPADDVRHFVVRRRHRESRFARDGKLLERTVVAIASRGWSDDSGEHVEGAALSVDGVSGDVQVHLCRLETAVAEDELQCAKVHACFEAVSGERVTERVERHVLRDPGALADAVAGVAQGGGADRLVGRFAGEEPGGGASRTPVLSEKIEEFGMERHQTIPLPFALADTNLPAVAVEVRHAEVHELGDPDSGGVCRSERGPMLHGTGGFEEPSDFLSAEDDGKLARLLGERQALEIPRHSQGVPVEEPECAYGLVERRERETLPDQVHLVRAHFLGTELAGAPAEVLCEPRHVVDVVSRGVRREVANPEVFDHPLSKRRHFRAPSWDFSGSRGSSFFSIAAQM